MYMNYTLENGENQNQYTFCKIERFYRSGILYSLARLKVSRKKSTSSF
jgi:hypothetical protein